MNKAHKDALGLYNLAWSLAIPVFRRNRRLAKGFEQRTLQDVKLTKADVWIQAASAGEAKLAHAIFKQLNPGKPTLLLLTSNTRQGLEILERTVIDSNANGGDVIGHFAYCPFDKPAIMEKAVAIVKPSVMVLLESEIWPGLIVALKKFQAKILVLNGRMTPKSLSRYLIWPSLWHALRPDKILAISETDAERFGRVFGQKVVEVMPNIKFDGINNVDESSPINNPLEKIIRPGTDFVVFGSIRKEEERVVEKIITDILIKFPEIVIGLFPRHMHRLEYWKKTLNRMTISWTVRSKMNAPAGNGSLILWDRFGELSSAYRLAKGAIVGGSLAPLGGQNFLEPLVYGIVPVIGPSWENFAWAGKEIVEKGLVKVAANWREAAQFLAETIATPAAREQVRKTAFSYFNERQGGTDTACRLIVEYLNAADS
jgi:3-deoxy-D-manno-octulosonic-acid transferase